MWQTDEVRERDKRRYGGMDGKRQIETCRQRQTNKDTETDIDRLRRDRVVGLLKCTI